MPNKDAHMTLLLEDHANIIVTGHFGNFEAAGYITGLLGIKSSAIARPLDNPYVDEYLVRFRSSTGQSILPKEGSAAAIEKLLENKGCLTILADQHAGDRGCWVDFFGHLTSCHKALALFVLTGGVPMTVCYARRLDRPLRFEIGITGVADPRHAGRAEQQGIHDSIESVTAWYNRCLEQAIRKAPEQYWWLHRRWRTVPPAVLKRIAKRSNTTETHRTN
jgi:KDO2-lipid IV(A) lauroyltransferase